MCVDFQLYTGSGLDKMMDEAVALAMAPSDDDGEDSHDDNDTNNEGVVQDEKVDESVNDSTPTIAQRTQSTPPPPPPEHLSTNSNDREAQQKEIYCRRNQELDLTRRYAPKDRCWLIGCFMGGPFQLCMK